MCVIIKEYACGHQEMIIQDCVTVKNLKRIQSENISKRRGFFNTLFCRKQKPEGPKIICTALPGLQSSRLPCQRCTPRPQTPEEVRQIAEWKNKQRKKRDRDVVRAGVKVLDQSEIERRRLNTKWQWLCTRCRDEGRIVESWHRKPNGGPCCARGVDEFDAWEQNEGYLFLGYRPSQTAHHANHPRDPSPHPLQPRKKYDSSLLPAKIDASSATKRYGYGEYDQDSHLSPELVRDFISMSGTDARSLPPPPLEPHPYYEDAGIELKRWNMQRRTYKGSYPAPSQPPTGPLPVKPLRPQKPAVHIPDKLYMADPLRRVSGQVDLKNPVPTTPEGSHSVQKKAVSISRHAGPSTPSRLSMPTSSSWSAGPLAAPRKPSKNEEFIMPCPGGQFMGKFSDTPSRPSRQPTQTSLPSRPQYAERLANAVPSPRPTYAERTVAISTSSPVRKPVASSGPPRPSGTAPAARTPSRPSRAGASCNRPTQTLPPPSERRMISTRGPIAPTPDRNAISPLSSPVSDPSTVSPIKNQIDEAIEYFSAASESSDERERGHHTWYE